MSYNLLRFSPNGSVDVMRCAPESVRNLLFSSTLKSLIITSPHSFSSIRKFCQWNSIRNARSPNTLFLHFVPAHRVSNERHFYYSDMHIEILWTWLLSRAYSIAVGHVNTPWSGGRRRHVINRWPRYLLLLQRSPSLCWVFVTIGLLPKIWHISKSLVQHLEEWTLFSDSLRIGSCHIS